MTEYNPDPCDPLNVMYRQHLERLRAVRAEGLPFKLAPVRTDAVVPRGRQDLRDYYTGILEGKIVRNLSVYPVTVEEKRRWLEKQLEEFRAPKPLEEARFGDLTGAILLSLLADLDRSPESGK